jgi:hypothetical protein
VDTKDFASYYTLSDTHSCNRMGGTEGTGKSLSDEHDDGDYEYVEQPVASAATAPSVAATDGGWLYGWQTVETLGLFSLQARQ